MSRLMSVAYTADAVIERRKSVTRRLGWEFLTPGTTLTLCRKVQGRRRPDGSIIPLERLAEVEVVDVRREPLARLLGYDFFPPSSAAAWAAVEMEREGFPGMDPARFVQEYFIDAQKVQPETVVTRIEWRYLDMPTPDEVAAAYAARDEDLLALR